ncbi:filamentous hemagglutinin N-terminal domain-containing protein [Burkholderia seminalis]|uniref:two-partner secretion domain-containing protein n=1 Tax=Burkholderia seminalis TaxID=488731 RepID=UPI0014549923|nr:filamentous hemagglutinin N-terminal domain-containing protein [Burkholderia seminalis]MCA8435445.1 filamentous hemagglutinin N-terminal domain-containing protein [Burkholderia seminalis]VWC36413.1 Adhesin HecA family protein [Burkholderia seminalis]
MPVETLRRTLAARHVLRDIARQQGWMNYRLTALSHTDSAGRPLWMRVTAIVMVAVTYFAPAVFLADEVAHAAPIVDPRAPIPFQPTITQTSSGVPAVNIATPNSNGVSLNQYQSFGVDSQGLVLNNSTVAGTPLLGGTLGANPNLNGRSASLIINQVTATGPAASLYGPLEVFGSPAAVVVASPNGVSVNGLSVTNVTNLTLTTGTPQFLTGVGGTPTDFTHAGAVAYDVRSGNISINGPVGNDGTPGAGVEGTVGNLDVVGQSVTINAPLRANQRVNVVTGNQLVTPTASDATGITYGTAANGAANTGAAIGRAIAVDASQYGSVTSGTVYIVSTAAGMGVNTQGPLSATAGNVVVQSNGDVSVGQTFANQNVNLSSVGNTSISGTGLANQNYTVTSNGDISAPGSVSAGQNVSMTAGGNLNAASVAANGAANLTAGQSMTIGSLSAHDIALQTTNGDLTVGGLNAPGTVSAKAGRDLTVNGAVEGGSTVALAGARNAIVNGQVSGVGDTTITAQTGSATVNGNALSNGALSVTAGQGAAIGGTVQAQGPETITAQAGSLTGQGNVTSSQGAVNLNAGQAIGLTGAVQSGSTINATAGTSASFGGTVSAPGAVTIRAGQDTTVGGNVTSGGSLSVMSGRNTNVQGTAASIGNMTLAANSGSLTTAGDVVSLGTLNATGQQGVSLGGTVYSGGNAQIGSTAGNVAVAGAVSTPGTISINARQDATVAGTLHSGQTAAIAATRDVNLNGGVEVDNAGNATVTAGRDITGSGAMNVANDTTLNAGNNIAVSGAIQTGNNLIATAGQNLAVGGATAVGNSALIATNGSATLTGNALSGGTTTISAGTDVNAQGSLKSFGDLAVTAKSGSLTAGGPVATGGNATLSAGQSMTLNGQTTVSKDASLTATNITTQGVAVGGNLTVNASNNLDTSAGQLNAPFDANAPALSVGGNATLSGANVTTANAVVGGTTAITGTQSVTTGGTAAFKGGATLAGGTVTNVGTQLSGSNLTVSGSNVSNTGTLSSLATSTVNAANLTNSGSIYGATTGVTVSGTTTNSGSLLATNALNLTTNALSNRNGLIFAGDVNNKTAPTGDVTVTVNGGNGTYDNTAGQILAQHDLTLNLPNQAFDPSAASAGTINIGNALTINAQQINNSGTWAMPGNSVALNAAQGMTNTGTISKAGDITLSTNGTFSNSGTISSGNNVNLSGTVVNQSGGTISANQDVNLAGVVTNAGTVSAVRDVNLSGSSYDNTGALTKAGRDLNASLSGDLVNVGGTISAQNNVTINAANVNNSRAGGNATSTTTSTTDINTAGLGRELLASPMGTETLSVTYENVTSGLVSTDSATITARVGDLQPASATSMSAPDISGGTLYGVALPTVTRTTTTTQASGAAGVIAAGNDLAISTGTLNNHGSTISAGHNATLNVAALDNGGDAKVTTITDSIDAASYTAFLTQLKNAYAAGNLVVLPGGTFTATANITPGQVSAPALQTSTITSYTSQDAGQIVAGNNLNLNGTGSSLTNAGNLYAGQDLTIHANAFTNQGYHTSNLTSTVGCAAGVADSQCGNKYITQAFPSSFGYNRPGQAFTDAMPFMLLTYHSQSTVGFSYGPNNDSIGIYGDQISTQSYSYTQTNNTVFAGRDLTIAAPTVSNNYGNLLAGRDVVIGGAGTSRDNTDPTNPQTTLTQGASVTNSSGNIQAGRDIAMSTASLTNTPAAPQQVYQNYGTTARYGCSGAFQHYCDAFVDMQSGDASTISANRNLFIGAGSVTNTGSLITAGGQATVTATSTVTNQDQTLNAYWHDGFYGGIVGGSPPPDNFGCRSSGTCSTLFGSAYQAGAGIQPPTPYKSLPGTIQAPSLTVTAGGTVQNSGNVMGQQVSVTGATLVNGLTSPNVYTPQPTASQQVIPLGPVGVPASASTAQNGASAVANSLIQSSVVAGAVSGGQSTAITSQTVGTPRNPAVPSANTPQGSTVQTIATANSNPTYLINNPASQVIGGVGPSDLIANLPANLRPDSTLFYYDPFSENQLLQQAALAQTGTASFVDGLKYDNQNQKSVTDQEKSVLYGNAIAYAKANNIALGTALSAQQIASLDAPMLWYVEETVPEPGCTATGVASCPTVTALMPQVYLPQNYAVVQHDGTISGQDVSLVATNKGSITNTGTITATGTLSIDAGTVTNQQRSTDVGTIYTYMPDVMGLLTTTGTVTQQGGFMSAANYNLNVDRLNQVGGALQKLDPNGQVDASATANQLAALKNQLGGNFTQSTVSDNLHTSFKSLADSPGLFEQIGMAVTAVVASFITAGAASALMPGVMATTVGGSMISAGVGGFSASAISQASTGQFSLTAALEGGVTGAITAGLTNGITYSPDAGVGWAGLGAPIGNNSLSALAGVKNLGGAIVPQAGASTATSLGQTALALGAEATIQAGVQTAIQGGSFLTNLKNSAVSDLAAAVAYGIGDTTNPYTAQNVLEHAALGCAAGAALGQGCGGGAVGAATSALIAPLLVYAAAKSGADPYAQQALVGGLATAVGGAAAAAAGQNVQAGMTAAQNNALNNDLQHVDKVVQLIDKARASNATLAGKYTSDDLLKAAENVYGGNGGPNGMRVWNSLADAQAGTAARGTTFYQDAQGQYVEQWKVPAGAEDQARNIVDNALHTYGPSYANVTQDNLGQLMSTYIAKFGADTSNFQGMGEGAAGLGLAGSLIKKETSTIAGASNFAGDFVLTDNRATKIFGTRDGHIVDTPENRALLTSVANNPSTTLGPDKYGTVWSAQLQSDGSQVWVQTRNGQIWNGGVNKTPLPYNPETGLAAPTKPGWK